MSIRGRRLLKKPRKGVGAFNRGITVLILKEWCIWNCSFPFQRNLNYLFNKSKKK